MFCIQRYILFSWGTKDFIFLIKIFIERYDLWHVEGILSWARNRVCLKICVLFHLLFHQLILPNLSQAFHSGLQTKLLFMTQYHQLGTTNIIQPTVFKWRKNLHHCCQTNPLQPEMILSLRQYSSPWFWPIRKLDLGEVAKSNACLLPFPLFLLLEYLLLWLTLESKYTHDIATD